MMDKLIRDSLIFASLRCHLDKEAQLDLLINILTEFLKSNIELSKECGNI